MDPRHNKRRNAGSPWSELKFALSCHSLAEFPYQPSPIDHEDEPLFFGEVVERPGKYYEATRPALLSAAPHVLIPHLFDHVDVFVGKSVLELCWAMCMRVRHLTHRIAVLTDHVANLPRGTRRNELKKELLETIKEKQIAYTCFQDRAAGIEAYQKVLLNGGRVYEAIHAGITAENKAVGPYNPVKNPIDYLAPDVPELKASSTKSKRFKKDIGYRVCPAIALPEREVRFNVVTPEDVDWANRQSAFEHSRNMPRPLKYFCPDCVEILTVRSQAVRVMRGVYLPIEHECPEVRVYDGVPVSCKGQASKRKRVSSDGEKEVVSSTEIIDGLYEVPSEYSGFQPHHETFVGNSNKLAEWEEYVYDPRPKSKPLRISELFEAKQEWKQTPPALGVCNFCGSRQFARKGTKFCLAPARCGKAYWEAWQENEARKLKGAA